MKPREKRELWMTWVGLHTVIKLLMVLWEEEEDFPIIILIPDAYTS